MTHRERFYATVNREAVDRPARWLGEPTSGALPGLLKYFRADSLIDMKKKLGDDVYHVNIPYSSPAGNHIAQAFDFTLDHGTHSYEERTLTAAGFFESHSDPSGVDLFDWPDPEKYIDVESCRRIVQAQPEDSALMALAWSAHFQDSLAAFGMENALIKMMTDPEIYVAVLDKIVDFYLRANEIFYEATRGYLDAVLIGNDFGSQQSLILSPDLLRRYVFPGTKKLIDQAHSYGLKVVHHSCGAIFDIIPDLIELGADVIHPIQALARDMDGENLQENFAGKISFCGGVDAQNLLVNGDPGMVKEEVERLSELFPTGLIISPSHEAILPDISPANVEALFCGEADTKNDVGSE